MTTYEKIVALIAELEADEKKTCNNDECADISLAIYDAMQYLTALIDAQRALEKLKAYY